MPGQSNLEIAKSFSYYHTGRLLETKCKVGSATPIVLNAMRYNAVGELVTKYLHSPDTGSGDKAFVQKTDYAYNIRGWLTAINDPNLTQDNDVFGMALCYNNLDGIGTTGTAAGGARFNGNISAVRWNAKGDKQRGYGFGYDGFNRLKKSVYGEGATLDANTNAFDENINEYDANGNITKLQRKYNGTLADDLTYTYELGNKSNRLKNVADPMGDEKNVSDYVVRSTGDYGYDANGNMTADPGKGTTIAYNCLNLPECVSFTNNKGKLFYHYDAAGRKLAQFVENNDGGQNKLTDYVGGTVYTDNQPSFAATEEGRLVPGGADLLQTTSYYPFGLTMAQTDHYNETTNYRKNRYLYNGKELQSDGFGGVELGWLDYGARMYDPSGVRFTTIDPKAHYFYSWTPYCYGKDAPITHTDPDGRVANWIVGAIVGGGVDYGFQVAKNMANGHGFLKSLTHKISLTSIGFSAVAGAATSGISAFATGTKGAIALASVPKGVIQVGEITCIGIVDATTGGANEMVNNAIDGKPLTEGVIEAAVLNAVTGQIGDAVSKGFGNMVETSGLEQVVKTTTDRNARVGSNSSQEAADAATSQLNAAKTINNTISSTTSETTQATGNAVGEAVTGSSGSAHVPTRDVVPVDNTKVVKQY